MALVGIVVTLAGFGLSVASLGMMSSTAGRFVMILVGISISLVGIMGVINPAFQKNAVWKK
jgi:NADH:ubiquinone oxidoreductase subunit 4 (subunit M)